jgi:radical SAM protein with 4Fe4S-binding SPASM domain
MCWLHGADGLGNRYEGVELSTGEISDFLCQAARYKSLIYLGGAEPLLRKDFLEILKKSKELDLYVFFTSNGTLLDSEKIREIVKLGVDEIIFSIDGGEELHDSIRGRGTFQKLTSNIKELLRYKSGRQCEKPRISVNIRITPFIIGNITKNIRAIDTATDHGVDSFRLHQLWYLTEKELQLHQASVKKYLNCSARGAACHLNPMADNINMELLTDEINRLRRIPRIKLYPQLSHQEMQIYFSEGTARKRRCLAPFYNVVIKPNGDVVFCPDEWIDDYSLGNIRTTNFDDIWNNEKARFFRSVIFRQKSFPGCKRCNWLYAF